MNRLCVVVPLYNDWASFQILLRELNEVALQHKLVLHVRGVDDGSSDTIDALLEELPICSGLESVEVVHLAVNVGHQRAIAIGMCLSVDEAKCDAIVVMDGDGEDRPQDIVRLLQAVNQTEHFCIVAQRRRRTENLTFRLSYLVYKFLFATVTGKRISFGNFCVMSISNARRLTLVSDLWNNLPAAILRSRLPITRVAVDRGSRYAGRSKMNFVSLVVHGMSGISVYADAIFVRLLMFTLALAVGTALAISVVVGLRLFLPQHATPGWATTVSFGMLIILLQVGISALFSVLMLLNSRVQRQVLPRFEYTAYVAERRMVSSSALRFSKAS